MGGSTTSSQAWNYVPDGTLGSPVEGAWDDERLPPSNGTPSALVSPRVAAATKYLLCAVLGATGGFIAGKRTTPQTPVAGPIGELVAPAKSTMEKNYEYYLLPHQKLMARHTRLSQVLRDKAVINRLQEDKGLQEEVIQYNKEADDLNMNLLTRQPMLAEWEIQGTGAQNYLPPLPFITVPQNWDLKNQVTPGK